MFVAPLLTLFPRFLQSNWNAFFLGRWQELNLIKDHRAIALVVMAQDIWNIIKINGINSKTQTELSTLLEYG